MYVDERVGEKPIETEREIDRKREEEVRSVRKMETCNGPVWFSFYRRIPLPRSRI